MKRGISLLLAMLMVFSLLTGCGQSQNNEPTRTTGEATAAPETTAPEKEKEALTGTLSLYGSKDAWRETFAPVADLIAKEKGIKLDIVTLPDEQIESVISVKLSTNDAPDLFMSNAPQTVDLYNATETCEVLDNEPWVERLAAPDLLRYKGDGKIYAMPSRESSSFFGGAYYNKELMKKMGFENPQPKTYQEFLDICEAIKKQGVTPIWMTDKDAWCTQVWTTVGWAAAVADQAPGIYEKLNTNKLKFADVPEFVTVLQNLQDLHTAGYTNKDHMSQTYDTAKAAIAEGKAVMAIQGEWFATDVHALYPDVELGSFAIPFLDKQMIGTGAFVTGFFVPKGGNVELAKTWLNYWSQPEYLNKVFVDTAGFPAFKDVEGGEVLPAITNIVDNFIKTGKYTNEFDSYFDAARPVLNDTLFGNIQEVTIGKPAKEALQAWDEKFQQFMKDKEMPGF